MLKRLMTGIVIGLVVGAIAAGVLIKGLGILSFATMNLGPLVAYLAALATGAFVALVAGKPIWAKGAWIEVGLKAFFGSLLAAGGMFALRRWGLMSVNLASFGAGAGAIGFLPATALPILATVLSVFFEIDNTDAPEEQAPSRTASKSQIRVAASASAASLPGARAPKAEADDEEEGVASKKQRR
jgi:energy-converting hydrogenase Eha subunit A